MATLKLGSFKVYAERDNHETNIGARYKQYQLSTRILHLSWEDDKPYFSFVPMLYGKFGEWRYFNLTDKRNLKKLFGVVKQNLKKKWDRIKYKVKRTFCDCPFVIDSRINGMPSEEYIDWIITDWRDHPSAEGKSDKELREQILSDHFMFPDMCCLCMTVGSPKDFKEITFFDKPEQPNSICLCCCKKSEFEIMEAKKQMDDYCKESEQIVQSNRDWAEQNLRDWEY